MTEREKFIILLDSDSPSNADSIILLEGDGYARYRTAVSLLKADFAPTICFSGNFDDEKSGAYAFDKIKPLLLAAGVAEFSLLHEDKSTNTYEQAVEVIKIAKEKRWGRIILVASQYHVYRAFLTFLCVQQKEMPDLFIDVAVANGLDWYEDTGWGRRIDLLAAEFEKIEIYHKKSNVASYAEGIRYLEWKYQKQKESSEKI